MIFRLIGSLHLKQLWTRVLIRLWADIYGYRVQNIQVADISLHYASLVMRKAVYHLRLPVVNLSLLDALDFICNKRLR